MYVIQLLQIIQCSPHKTAPCCQIWNSNSNFPRKSLQLLDQDPGSRLEQHFFLLHVERNPSKEQKR